MSETPSLKTAAYPRAGAVPTSKLRLLIEGGNGLNILFAITVALNIGFGNMLRTMGPSTPGSNKLGGVILLMFLIVSIGSFKYVKKIGEGLDWPESKAKWISVLLGLNSAICCGAIGFILVLRPALKKLQEGGIDVNLIKFNAKQAMATIESMERQGL